MTKELQHIGSRELISFPEMGVVDVPAKVDTGADSSSIWASDIKEKNGELSFALFAPGSRRYTGERVTTTSYVVTYVRNSFGHIQERYKVKFLVRIRSKKVRIEMSLADRSRNRYPILIGKATLRNRFFVDVTKDGILRKAKPVKVLVMNSKNTASTRAFFEEISAVNPGVECYFATYDEVRFDISGRAVTCSVVSQGMQLTDYDLIYFKTYFQYAEVAAAMAEVARAQGVEFIDLEVGDYHATTKLTQYVKLARHGVAVPDSIVTSNKYLGGSFAQLSEKFGPRFIMKNIASERGESNFLVTSEKDFDIVCKQAARSKALYVVQRYVENDGDYRVVVLDKRVMLVIRRTTTDMSTHLTNTSKGGVAERIPVNEFDAEPAAIAVRAAVLMNRQVAGVDLVFDKKNKKWLVFEVNNSPQIASGSYIEEKQEIMSRFLRTYAKK